MLIEHKRKAPVQWTGALSSYSFAVTVTPSIFGKVFGAPMAAPMIMGKGTGFSGAAVIEKFFGSSI